MKRAERGQRPPEVEAAHLSRQAIIYLRQSSGKQVIENTGSTMDQRNQVRYARKWGWPENLIEVISDDLGKTGKIITNRNGYQRIMERLNAGLVGPGRPRRKGAVGFVGRVQAAQYAVGGSRGGI
jgi:hypothetical protein